MGTEKGILSGAKLRQSVIALVQLHAADIFLLGLTFSGLALLPGFPGRPAPRELFGVVCAECGCLVLAMHAFRANRSLWRYATASDSLRLMVSYAAAFLLALAAAELFFRGCFPALYLLLGSCVSLVASLFIRMLAQLLLCRRKPLPPRARPGRRRDMILLGAGHAAVALLRELQNNPASPYCVRALLDDDPLKIGRSVGGVPVRGRIELLPRLLETWPQCDVVLAIPSLGMERRRQIIGMCADAPCRFRIMPDTMLIMENGGSYAASMRKVKIEDLLGRTTVTFEKNELDQFIKGKTVLITGGGGSIGSELCRQVSGAGVGRLVVFEMDENDSYLLCRELKHLFGTRLRVHVEIGSVADERRVDEVFRKYRPDVVFHAAAHKHVPLMEDTPYEAVRNNIFGTWNVLRASRQYAVRKFVLISTDKAVNPTSVMGATKRYCERMAGAMAGEPGGWTDFIAVRFGNVIGSQGSVIPLFQMQLEHGGPLTVTDRRVTRFFMTIPEAAGLVIKAASMAKRSETFILDMGRPVKILELAENFIRHSGFQPYTEIPIVETGLRPGEKLFEEVLVNDGKHCSTSVSRIFIEQNTEHVALETVLQELDTLRAVLQSGDAAAVRAELRRVVPSYRPAEEVNGRYLKEQEAARAPAARPAAPGRRKEPAEDAVVAAKAGAFP